MNIHVASIIASKQALEYICRKMPDDKTTIWIAALDNELDDHSYIIPGLGDAGDLAYRVKKIKNGIIRQVYPPDYSVLFSVSIYLISTSTP